VRILFLSDTHLGLDLPARPRVERRRRGDDFFRNFKTALEVARRGEVDVVVHGGDLLYRSRVPAWLAEAARAPLKALAASGVPVLLVAGNHERGRMPYPLLAIDENLHLFDRPRTVVLEAHGVRVAFAGFPSVSRVRHRFSSLLEDATRHAPPADVKVLCLHQCVEGATCGPAGFTFRHGDDVIRQTSLPQDVAVTLCGHIHRHQVLQPPGRAPVIYAGSIERTSFAEAAEMKGFVVLELTRSGLVSFEFRPLQARPMVKLSVAFDRTSGDDVLARMAAAIGATPADAVVQIRVSGAVPSVLTASALRSIAGARNVALVASR
jgi:DNA repair exonuclease SbcCD nuclease subunit